MFKQNIVLVVGAGASFEYKLPLGLELKERIAKSVRFRFEAGRQTSGDPELLEHIRRHVKGKTDLVNEYSLAANALAQAIPSFVSIDEALHFVSEDSKAVEIGKVAIVDQIVRGERESELAYDTATGRIRALAPGWLSELFSMAVSGVRKAELGRIFDHVTFINFNYDRVIEHYLYWALQEHTGASSSQAMEIVEGLSMLRPYGSIGKYSPNFSSEAGFGTSAYFDPFKRLEALGTYTDDKPLHDLGSMLNVLASAKLVVFLGFGYHSANLGHIKLSTGSGSATVLGTIKGIHPSNHHDIARRIAENLGIAPDRVDLHDIGATSLLAELRPRILALVG